jgi:hypothetical protein
VLSDGEVGLVELRLVFFGGVLYCLGVCLVRFLFRELEFADYRSLLKTTLPLIHTNSTTNQSTNPTCPSTNRRNLLRIPPLLSTKHLFLTGTPPRIPCDSCPTLTCLIHPLSLSTFAVLVTSREQFSVTPASCLSAPVAVF